MYYIGLDVHKRTISYCVKDVSGKIHSAGSIPATRLDLDRWLKNIDWDKPKLLKGPKISFYSARILKNQKPPV